jgi:hypothetical protein
MDEDEGRIYPDEEFESWKERLKDKGDLNPFATLFMMAASIYIMYISLPPIILYFTNGIDVWGLVFYIVLFTVGIGAFFGGIAMARHTILYGRLLDSTFEKEIYSRLEPAFEEVGKLRAENKVIYDKMDRINLYLNKMNKDIGKATKYNGNGNGNGKNGNKYNFLMVFTLGALFYIFNFPLDYVPYALTSLFIIWWIGIASEFNLWKVDFAWAWAVFPIFVVPIIALLMHIMYGIPVTVGVMGILLVIYAMSFHTWARYYLEGVSPLRTIKDKEFGE